MEIKIMSQEEAENWSHDQWMGVALLISILGTDTRTPTFYKNPRIIEKISLKFDDIQSVQDHHTLLSEEHCLQIRDFVFEHAEEVESIVIHCFAGVSRGAAIAFAVCRLLGLDDTWIWASNRYHPNEYCVYKLNRILNLGLSDAEIQNFYLLKEKNIS
ncbi:MAG: dual specificity protein phosphatase family protein [Turicibacter sp.]|nr:dual specificity protein phosphatase family protein [Turicibacter sp.]MEE1238118.1 hypothetical protein [Turicibacter sp.]